MTPLEVARDYTCRGWSVVPVAYKGKNPVAGRHYYDLSKNASYAAAKRGDIPTIRVGRLLRVPVVAMERRLDEAGAIPRRPEAEGFVRS